MRCKYCNAENQDGAVFCRSCGSRIDGKIICPKCGALTPPDMYCNTCGALLTVKKRCTKCGTIFTGERCPVCNPAKESAPVKKRCTKCGTIFTGERCPVCNPAEDSVPTKKKRCTKCGTIFTGERCPNCFPQKESVPAAKPAAARRGAVPAQKAKERERTSGGGKDAVEEAYQRNRSASVAFCVIGLIGVAVVLAFTFLVGWKSTLKLDGEEYYSEKQSMYYFFGEAYSGISGRRAYTSAVTGSVITGGMMLAMTVMSVLCVVRFVLSLRSEVYRPFLKYVLITYLLFVAFTLMFRSMVSLCYDGTESVLGEGMSWHAETSLTWPVIVGLAAGGALVATSYVGSSVLAYQRKPRFSPVKRYAVPFIAAALLIASAAILSGVTMKLKYSYGSDGLSLSYSYAQGYTYWVTGFDNQTVFTYAYLAELMTYLYMPLAMVVAAKLLTHAYNPRQKNGFMLEYVLASAFFVALAVFAALLGSYVYASDEIMNEVFVDVLMGDEGTIAMNLNILYIGAGAYAAAFALCVVHMAMKPMRPSARREKISFSNRIYS